eukprot:Nk52_evm79s2367 gene=Nk52_evmTU79s2367
MVVTRSPSSSETKTATDANQSGEIAHEEGPNKDESPIETTTQKEEVLITQQKKESQLEVGCNVAEETSSKPSCLLEQTEPEKNNNHNQEENPQRQMTGGDQQVSDTPMDVSDRMDDQSKQTSEEKKNTGVDNVSEGHCDIGKEVSSSGERQHQAPPPPKESSISEGMQQNELFDKLHEEFDQVAELSETKEDPFQAPFPVTAPAPPPVMVAEKDKPMRRLSFFRKKRKLPHSQSTDNFKSPQVAKPHKSRKEAISSFLSPPVKKLRNMMTPNHKDKSSNANSASTLSLIPESAAEQQPAAHKYVDPRLSRAPQVVQKSVLWAKKYEETIKEMNENYESNEEQKTLRVHPLSKSEIKRQETIFELVFSEKQYVEDLKTITDVFVKPFKAYETVVSSAERKAIFGNVTDICNFNSAFYDALSKTQNENGIFEFIAKELKNLLPKFLVYSEYCCNNLQAKVVYDEISKIPIINELLKSTQGLARCRKLDCWSFLDSPRRRLQKYNLLFERILKFTEQRVEEHAQKICEVQELIAKQSKNAIGSSESADNATAEDSSELTEASEYILKLKSAVSEMNSSKLKLEEECEELKSCMKILDAVVSQIDERTGEADEIFKYECLCRSLQYLDEKWRVDLGITEPSDRKLKKEKSFNASIAALPYLKSSLNDYQHRLILDGMFRTKNSQEQKLLLFDHILLITKVIHRRDNSVTHQVCHEPISLKYCVIEDVEDDTVRFGRPLSFSSTLRRSESGSFRLPDKDHNSAFDSKNVIRVRNESNGKSYTLQAPSAQHKETWIQVLNEAVKVFQEMTGMDTTENEAVETVSDENSQAKTNTEPEDATLTAVECHENVSTVDATRAAHAENVA